MPRIVDFECTECKELEEDVFTDLIEYVDFCTICGLNTIHKIKYSAPNIHVKNPDPARRGRGRSRG